MQHTTMFAHDDTTIFCPTAPGRVFSIVFTALADCEGSDEDFEDSTVVADLANMVYFATKGVGQPRVLFLLDEANPVPPDGWPSGKFADEFHDFLELWADWCDRHSARLDMLEGEPEDADAAGVLARLRRLIAKPPYTMATLAEVVSAIGEGQPVVLASN